ncbi:hypothetical protein [Peribacillus butanolivorans]
MRRNWINSYVLKLTGKAYEQEEVHSFIDHILARIDDQLRHNEQGKTDFDKDKNEILFPDCVITFEILKNNLEFKKYIKGNRSLLGKSVVHDNGRFYELKDNRNNGIIEDEESLLKIIESAIAYLLVDLVPR